VQGDLGRAYLRDGFVVRPVADREALCALRRVVVESAAAHLGVEVPPQEAEQGWLDEVHHHIDPAHLNDLRVRVMAHLADHSRVRPWLLALAEPYLEDLVGNELAIQLRPNLSVQLPGDLDSVLALHADTWSGHSPFEIVVWVPLVDCWGTKSMYLTPPGAARDLWERFEGGGATTTDDLFAAVEDVVRWITVPFGEVLLFDQSLPHGNRANLEPTTRWSINCRFTGVFTPYADKGLGDFFTPARLRPVTVRALGLETGTGW